MKTTILEIKKVTRIALYVWCLLSTLIAMQCIWIYARHGLSGFQAYVQDSPFTFVPLALASAGFTWLLSGLFVWLVYSDRLNRDNLCLWAGFFITAFAYLNILRERVRYGDIGYYTEAAFSLVKHQPLPDSYVYPPLWAVLLSFLTPLGEDGILIVCWIANILSLFAFHYLLQRILQHYQFSVNAAAIITTLFMLVNMPLLRTLMYVQVNLHVVNMIFLAILFYKDRPVLSAFFLALAVHFKTSPALLVLAFLLEFNWKWFAYFAAGMILIMLFTTAFYGFRPYLEFMNNAALLGGPREFSMRDSSFDSAISVTFGYLHVSGVITRTLVYLAKGITTLLAILLGLRTTSLFPDRLPGSRLYNAIIPFLFAMTIASPLIWEHHGIFLSLPFLVLLTKVETPAEWVWFSVAYLFVFLTPAFDFFPWSYSKLFGILTILGLLWYTDKRERNSFLSSFNQWASSLSGAG